MPGLYEVSMINVWTKQGEFRLYANRKANLIMKNLTK